MSNAYKFCWVLWIAGTVVIVASWNDVVSPEVGWIGFTAALAGTVLSFVVQNRPRRRRPPPSSEITSWSDEKAQREKAAPSDQVPDDPSNARDRS